MKRKIIFAATALLVTAIAAPAAGQSVGRSWRGYQKINKGVWELGLENLLLLRQTSAPDPDNDEINTSTLDVSYTGGITPRYFVADNFAIGINGNFFLRKSSVTVEGPDDTVEQSFDDTGFLGFVMANYYVRLGNSFFFKPGLGLGGFVGTRSEPVLGADEAGLTANSSLSGFAGRLDLGVAFYASSNVNLKAGIDGVFRAGSVTPESMDGEEVEGASFTSIDAGFNIGIAYTF